VRIRLLRTTRDQVEQPGVGASVLVTGQVDHPGQLISNMATALIIGPIAMAIAVDTGISPLPLLMGVAVAAAAAFLTPVATPANTMVLGPGGYRFGDYWKLGLPLTVFFVLVATFLVPQIWHF
jgi:di/tricarboxylate transporter